MTYQILDIIRGTSVDGPGFRTSIYFAGCQHMCPQCHNPGSWDFSGGRPMSLEDIMEIVREEAFDVTFSGGDPLYQADYLPPLIEAISREGLSVWVYTGFTWEQIINNPKLLSAIKEAEVVVDGPFSSELRDKDLLFRGSSNQRLINVTRSLATGKIELWTD